MKRKWYVLGVGSMRLPGRPSSFNAVGSMGAVDMGDSIKLNSRDRRN